MDCIFCKIAKGEIPGEKIWEDESFFAFLDINPINPGHVLIIPKKHGEYIFDLTDPDYEGLLRAAKKLAGPLKKATGAKRIGLMVEGFAVAHIHLHLVPLFNGGELDFGRASRAKPDALAEMGKKIHHEIIAESM